MNVNNIQDPKAKKKAKLEKSFKDQRLLKEKVERDLANFHENQPSHIVTPVYREATEEKFSTRWGDTYQLVGGTTFKMRKISKRYKN